MDDLADDLTSRGKSVWVDRQGIEAAAEWRVRIGRAIESAKALIFVVSPQSLVSTDADASSTSRPRPRSSSCRSSSRTWIPRPFRRRWPIGIGYSSEPLTIASVALDQVVQALESDLGWRDLHTRLRYGPTSGQAQTLTTATSCVERTSAGLRTGMPSARAITSSPQTSSSPTSLPAGALQRSDNVGSFSASVWPSSFRSC